MKSSDWNRWGLAPCQKSFVFCLLLSLAGPLIASCVRTQSMANEGRKRDSHIVVALRIAEADEVSKLFGRGTGSHPKGLYLLGEVTNTYPTSASVRLKVRSSNNPTIVVDDITVGWVGAHRDTVYFMRYLAQPPLKTPVEEVALDYDIVSVNRK